MHRSPAVENVTYVCKASCLQAHGVWSAPFTQGRGGLLSGLCLIFQLINKGKVFRLINKIGGKKIVSLETVSKGWWRPN